VEEVSREPEVATIAFFIKKEILLQQAARLFRKKSGDL
jgi:hypothetical protein